jgi:hypothetical protein
MGEGVMASSWDGVERMADDHVDYGQEFKIKDGNDLIKNFHIIICHGGDEWEGDDGETVTLWSSDVIQKGIQLLPDDRKIVIMNGGDWDADDADHIMQLGTFGEVVNG